MWLMGMDGNESGDIRLNNNKLSDGCYKWFLLILASILDIRSCSVLEFYMLSYTDKLVMKQSYLLYKRFD